MDLVKEGACIRDVYEVEWKLGEGAFAEVWRVKHRFLGRQAMKVFKAIGASFDEVEAALSEARLLSQLGHPNLVQVFDANVLDTDRGNAGFFTMTYVAGGTLEKYWTSFGAEFMPVDQVVEIGRQICRGLDVAHRSNPPIVHRDIKPHNVLVGFCQDGLRIRLSDFGLARQVSKLSLLASAAGTPGYKPPEALDNVDSPASDVWAVGAVLYKLLTDRLPFPPSAKDPFGSEQFRRQLRPPSVFNIKVDTDLEAIVLRCLAADSRHRYSHAGELLRELDGWKPGGRCSTNLVSDAHPLSKSTFSGRSDTKRRNEANRLLERALDGASNASTLAELLEAADALEAALTDDPSLRARYESRLQLWRRGINT